MAPVLPRQFYHFPPPPQPPKEPPATPVHVTSFINLKVLLELFTGTICIFVIGVLFWKIGKFFRSLSRGKVVGNGNTTTTRYARTWYGWVPWERHETNKDIFRKCAARISEWTSWKSSRADYRWVWWDPGNKELERHHQNQRPLRWLSKCLRSYSFTTADEIWNPGPPDGHNGPARFSTTTMTGAQRLPKRTVANHRSILDGKHSMDCLPSAGLADRLSNFKDNLDQSLSHERRSSTQRSHTICDKPGLFRSLNKPRNSPRGEIFLHLKEWEPARCHSASLPCLLNARPLPPKLHELSAGSQETTNTTECVSYGPRMFRYSRKYQVWSTQMQIQTSNLARNDLCEFIEPPGSPISELLASYSSEGNAFLKSLDEPRDSFIDGSSSSDPGSHTMSILGQHFSRKRATLINNPNNTVGAGLWSSTPALCHTSLSFSSTRAEIAGRNGFQSLCDVRQLNSHPSPSKPIRSVRSSTKEKSQLKKVLKPKVQKRKPIPFENWSPWEMRLIDGLDRRLAWLLGQLNPGRRPFHFSILANHWLNRETWIVLDPISRVPIDARRQLGDPRFNVPYQIPCWNPKPKYTGISYKKAHRPRIDSWRVAVNRHRRASGIRDIIKTVELYEGSAEEPPDGKVDTASWMLRKPPQGYEMSTKQKNAYYEGGAGWQETLSDWQKIRRGYRIRKAIHEGRVNRTRAKEIAVGITRCCRIRPSRSSSI